MKRIAWDYRVIPHSVDGIMFTHEIDGSVEIEMTDYNGEPVRGHVSPEDMDGLLEFLHSVYDANDQWLE